MLTNTIKQLGPDFRGRSGQINRGKPYTMALNDDRFVNQQRRRLSTKSALGKALQYALSRWDADCGGPPGYFEFIEKIASKRSKKAKDALEWYGSPYDPDDIDEQQIKITLGRIANSYRTGRSKTVKT